jgi:SNF2 family DNA or RNA helicase
MDEKRRGVAITKFRDDDSVTLLVMSIRAGSVGITLTEADTCVLMEPHTSRAVVEQCLSRVHRIGQTRPVYIKRLVYANTVEEHIQRYAEEAWERSAEPRGSEALRRVSTGLSAAEIQSFFS